jgi:transposase
VITAPMPAQPLPGSNASAAMIATVTAGKYVDGTPLYRMAHALVSVSTKVDGPMSKINEGRSAKRL